MIKNSNNYNNDSNYNNNNNNYNNYNNYNNNKNIELSKDGRTINVKTCKALHCDFSYSVCFTINNHNKDFRVAYSGDTRPNDFFARNVGYKCQLLIHEATHDNELQQEAKQKRHSTIGEAIGISELMKAENTILTHFSQRYPKLPELANLSSKEAKIGLAFDGMHVCLSQVCNQQTKFDQLRNLFEQDSDEI